MHGIDFTSWQSLLITLIGLALFTLISIGIRLLMMVTIQQRRERMNRQINERLRTLIAAYKTLGGSFTGNLTVDPTHRRDLHRRNHETEENKEPDVDDESRGDERNAGSERRRRIRDAVEAALSDIILLGTEEHVRLAECAVRELIAGHPLRTDDLVVSLRNFIRKALDIGPIPFDIAIPAQGPARPSGSGGRGKGDGGREASERGVRGGGMGGAGTGSGTGDGLAATIDDQSSSNHRL